MPLTSTPPPLRADLLMMERDPRTGRERSTGKTSKAWTQWFLGIQGSVDASAQQIRRLPLTAQVAAIPSTPIPMAALAGGLYRVSVYARITTPATTSSSLTISIGHTDGGVSCTQSGPAMTGNTTATVQGLTFVIRADQSTPVTYSTLYSSVGAQPMIYSLEIVVEAL